MGPLARAAQPPGEKMPLARRVRRKGAGQGREGASCSLPRPRSLTLLSLQLGYYFKPKCHFAFKPWEEHRPFKVLVQLLGSIQPLVNIDSWS